MTTTTSVYALTTVALYGVAAVGTYVAYRVARWAWTGDPS